MGDQDKPRGAGDLPIRFRNNTTFTFEPEEYRKTVELLKTFGVYDEAVKAMNANGVVIVLRSNKPEGVANAIEAMQKALQGSLTYRGARHFLRLANPTDNPKATEGCPIGKFAEQ